VAPAYLKKAIAKLVLVSAFSATACLGLGQPFAFARESGFLGQIFEREKAPVPPESVPSAVTEPQDAEAAAPASSQKKKAPVKKKAIANAPLPPPRPWGLQDAPSPQTETNQAAFERSPEPRRATDETSTIPEPPALAAPVEPPRRDVALSAPQSALTAEPAQPADAAPSNGEGGQTFVESEPEAEIEMAAPLAPPAASDAIAPSSTLGTARLDIAPDCKAVVLVRKGAFLTAKPETVTIARGQIDDQAYAKLVAASVPGLSIDVRDMDWISGLQSMASGQVDGVLVGVDRQRPEDLQQVWLGFYQLVQLPLRDSEASSCPRPAS
jgi:hypothetical protein